ncbi:MAG: hypothetical protein EZS26_003410 [Candidatus Ordinivivax streblomastigis]|uniref:Glycosyl hydrolase family 95 catalytic domain-containing protein n=1 Tax=Candidatus Ordinivivax streblomastigis TaxID=2540710 RepID=A0A5M8NXP6_9BACT|nr:MAG: hypothetical protein EZS26_003410 [Candidatus Ordinivivax streblomastigis]
MLNKNIIISIGVILLFLSACNEQANHTRQVASVVGKHLIRFTKPAERVPARVSVDAPLLGNGFTGVTLSGSPEKQIFYVARNDFWRLKSAYRGGYPAVLGKVELAIPGLEGASFLIEQQLYNAITTARFNKDGFFLIYKTYVAATEDILVVEISMEGKETLEGNVRLTLPGEKEIIDNPPLEPAYPDKKELNVTTEGIQYLSRAFEDSVDISTKAAIALRIEIGRSLSLPDGRFTLKQGKPLRFVCAFSSNFKSRDCVATVIQKVNESTPKQLAIIEKEHKQWWKNYWEKSFVSIPDTAIERQYYLSLYGTASCSRDSDFPPPIFGTWITQEQPNWSGDYHLNYNHQAPFYALYSANRIEQAEPYYRPVLAIMPRGEYYSEKVTKIFHGILLPVGIGPLGIETTRWHPLADKYRVGWKEKGNVEDEGLFWGQKSNAAYAVVNLSMQFYHTYDKNFCERVYPFVKGVAVFWENYLKYENDRYVIYNDAIHEGTVGNTNGILSLGLVKLVMQTAKDMSEFIGVDVDKRDKWMHINAHISAYPLQERNGKTVFRYTEAGIEWVNGNTLGIQHIYPGGQIGLDSDPELLKVAYNTVDEMQKWIDGNGSNSFFPAAVRVGYNPDTILYHLNRYVQHTFPNGYQLSNPHGIENLSTVPNTINEMLCMGHQGVVRLFPVWPRNKDAAFHQIRTEGAFLVSAELTKGEVTDLSIFSEQGRELTLLNPWKNRKVRVEEVGSGEKTYEGERIKISTKPGKCYRFEPEKE